MKKQLLLILILLVSVFLRAQTQINTLTDFTDFTIDTIIKTKPVIRTSTNPVTLTGTDCARAIFQKLHVATVIYDSIVVSYTIRTSDSSSIKDELYNNFFPVGVSYRKDLKVNADRYNPVHWIEFCGKNDSISFSNLLMLGYGPHVTGINEMNKEVLKNIYSSKKTIFIKDINLDGFWVSLYDLSSRRVYFGKATEIIETNLQKGLYIMTIQSNEKNIVASKKLILE